MRVWLIAPYLFTNLTGYGGGVFGAAVAHREFYRALLTHGRADEYIVYTSNPDQASRDLELLEPDARWRVRVRHLHRLPSALREGGCDLLHTTLPYVYPLARLRRRYAGSPFPICNTVVSALSYHRLFPGYAGDMWADLRPYDCLVFSSHACRQAWRRMVESIASEIGRPPPAARQEVIPLGVDTGRYRPGDRQRARSALELPAEALVVLSLARLSPFDKADLVPILMAFEREVLRQPELAAIRFVIAGADEAFHYGDRLAQFAAMRGIWERLVIVRNPDAETAALLYSAGDVFVAPYDCLQENFGQAPVEAMAAGLPVVAADWGPFRETIIPGVTGVLVPTCWAPCVEVVADLAPFLEITLEQLFLDQSVAVDAAALWREVGGLAGDPARRARLAAGARRRAEEEYAWPAVIARHEALWEALGAEAARAPGTPAGPGAPYFPDYFAAYRHYARDLLGEHSEVRLTPTGWEYLPRMHLLTPLAPMAPVLSPGLLLALVGACRVWAPLAELLTDDPDPLAAQRRLYHVLWLIKYGLLEYRLRPAQGG